jgi:hypothetical protein
MKHLKRFFESQDSDLEILKDYFYNLIDDLSDICNVNFKQNTTNFFTVYINREKKINRTIDQNTINLIDTWIDSNSNDSKIILALKESISRLEDHMLVESFTLEVTHDGWSLNIYTQLKGDANEWIFMEEDYSVWIDKLRLKKYLEKFGVKFKSYHFSEDSTKYSERYYDLDIYFEEMYPKDKLEEVLNALKEITIEKDTDEVLRQGKIFSGGKVGYSQRSLALYLADVVTDVQ